MSEKTIKQLKDELTQIEGSINALENTLALLQEGLFQGKHSEVIGKLAYYHRSLLQDSVKQAQAKHQEIEALIEGTEVKHAASE